MKRNDLRDLIFYEIYPTSFFDANNDGVGDLQGIIDKVDYLVNLGINAVWLNPFYVSPFKDGGYDVKDFFNVDPRFGTLDDFDRLIEVFHKNGIKVIIDLVAGHASEENTEFLKSAEGTRNECSDMFIWNNSVWSLEQPYRLISGRYDRDGCYMVNFFSTQPAFNFGFNHITHPDWQISYKDNRTNCAKNYLLRIMDFWLSRGCDGFRVDMADSLVKNDDEKVATIELWNELFANIKSKFPESIFVSEWSNPKRALKAGFDCDFILDHWNNCYHQFARANENTIGKSVLNGANEEKFINDLLNRIKEADEENGYLSFISGNHDTPRIASSLNEEQLKLFFLFILTMPGVPFIYYGDEIGMKRASITSKDGGYARTCDRTPMQWNNNKNFGFSEADELYLPVGLGNCNNVEDALKDKTSIYYYVRDLIALRKTSKDLQSDDFKIEVNNRIFTITRRNLRVIINLSNEVFNLQNMNILFGINNSSLKPNEGVIIKNN